MIQTETRIYAECDACHTKEYLFGVEDMPSIAIIAMITRPGREIPIRKNGVDISYYDDREWELKEGKLICFLCRKLVETNSK